jgi:hypothetical protein
MTSKAMRSAVCLFLLLGVTSTTAFAANKNRIGTAGAQELLIPVGARGVAMGPSAMVFSRGVDAIYYNPAGLGRMENSVQAMFSQMSYFADINVSYGAIGVNTGEFGNIGITLKTIGFGEIPVTTQAFPDGTGELYSPTFLTIGFTYAKQLTDRISVGLSASLLSEQILSMSASGVSFDVGIQYQNLGIQGLALGIAIKNLGPTMKFDGSNAYVIADNPNDLRGENPYKAEMAGFELPSNLEIGIGYSPKIDDKNSLSVGGMFRNNNYADDEYSIGAEYGFQNMFFVRGGYVFAPQTTADVTGADGYIYDYTLGAGINYNVSGVDLTFDYAYRHMDYFDGSHTFTFRVGF